MVSMGSCRENLVDKYKILGIKGQGIDRILVDEKDGGINAYVVGDVVKAMCRNPSLDLFKERPTGDTPTFLNLTQKGVNYLKNNIHQIIDEYLTFSGRKEITQEKIFDTSDITLSPNGFKYEPTKMVLESLAVIEQNGIPVILGINEEDKSSLLFQNMYGSISHSHAEDLKINGARDEDITGSRNIIKSGEKTRLFYHR